jgi:excisionase family DNA binding protein
LTTRDDLCILLSTRRARRFTVVDEEYYTIPEVAELLKVTRAAVYKWMAAGRLDYVYVGDDRRVSKAALAAFIKSSTEEGKAGETTEKKGAPGQLALLPN